jgi:hypothetical protein
MSPLLVAACYGSAAVLSLFALWHFGVKKWYWHVLSLVIAFGIGLTRLPEPFNRPEWTLVVGWFFIFFFLWGFAAPLVSAVLHGPKFHIRHH